MRGNLELFPGSIGVDDDGKATNIDGDVMVPPIEDRDDEDEGGGTVVLLLVLL